MQLKLKTRYAIRILLCLAQNREYVNAETLARQADVPLTYLHRIVGDLRNAKIVESIGGCKGGCRLLQAPPFINLYDVITAVDDLFHPATSPPEATDGESLYERETDVLLTIQNELRTALRGITLDSFCDTPSACSRYPAYRTHNANLHSTVSPQRREFG